MFTIAEPEAGQQNLLTPEASKVTQNTICIRVKKGRFGVKRKASMQSVTVESDKLLLGMSKTILDSPELKAVQKIDGEVARYLKGLCLKSMFKGGIYLIPLGLVVEVNEKLHEFAAKRAELVDAAVATYDQRTQETSERLEVLHDPTDYPSRDRFRSKFYLEWQFITWETPTKLKAIRPSLFLAEKEKAAAQLSAVADECRLAMRVGLKKLVDHMVERLKPDEDGKRKKFGKNTVENFFEFFRTFELKNVTDDAELATVVAQAKQVLSGIDVKQLKKDEAIRSAIEQQFASIKGSLDTITVGDGEREIEIEDDDDDDATGAAAAI